MSNQTGWEQADEANKPLLEPNNAHIPKPFDDVFQSELYHDSSPTWEQTLTELQGD